MDTYDDSEKSKYQLIAICCLYVSSCVYSDFPFALDTLCYICDECYTKEQIVDMMITFVPRISRSGVYTNSTDNMDGTIFKETNHTKCFRIGEDLVCKQMSHNKNGLPTYDVIVEIMVDRMVSSKNVIRMVGCSIDTESTKLYYKFIPRSLRYYFGSDDHVLLEKIIVQILTGVKDLHDRGIGHRDLKGDNIQVDEEDNVVIIDTGAAGFGKIRSTVPACTVTHRSPDILRAEIEKVDNYEYDPKKLDIWSLGVILAELFLGPDPFGTIRVHTRELNILTMIINNRPRVIEELKRVGVPMYITDSIQSCLSDVPDERPTIDTLLLKIK